MQKTILQISPRDNVAVALESIAAGTPLSLGSLALNIGENIPQGHKIALAAIPAGGRIIKFGYPIGTATADIAPGAWVHTHNVQTALAGPQEYNFRPNFSPVIPAIDHKTFQGYPRPDGQVGVRNEIWILPTVGCVNAIAETLARNFRAKLPLDGLEGVYAFQHPYGCSQLGDDHEHTRKILAGLARHPNAAGVLVIGLGCENNTMAGFKQLLGEVDPARYRFLVTQEVSDETAAGMQLLEELAQFARQARRQTESISKLVIGLKCGGSDGFSGITANPLLGAFSDWLINHGGTTVLTEVPEMFGAETILMNRCTSRVVFGRCVNMINGFKEYFQRHGQTVYENPSPGNKDGGITTLEEKSLGCIQKGGHSPVVDVLPYGGRGRFPGLNLLDGPGNDIVSVTALAAAGAHLVLFTTGRGTPLGGPVPTVKVASNSLLAEKKPNWIDFDAGRLIAGVPLQQLAEQFCEAVVEFASGSRLTRAEINGFREIAIFKDGVTL